MKLAVGVDVVDLGRPRAGDRSRDERFLNRVFTPWERERIRAAPDPALEVWVLWAAKEAGFKVASKLRPAPPVFRHAAFRVVDPPGSSVSHMSYQGDSVQLGVALHPDRALVWAWNGARPEILVARCRISDALEALELTPRLEEWKDLRFSPRERDAVRGLPSALVRLMARRDAARMLGMPEARLAITCPPGNPGYRPPFLDWDGERLSTADVSLSHDGDELAWAIRRTDSGQA